MKRSAGLGILTVACSAIAGVQVAAWQLEPVPLSAAPHLPMARGVVFEDHNGNGRRDSGERGIGGIKVSDQSQIVVTDREGRWEMPTEADGDTIYFVVKPKNFKTAVDKDKLPRFYYIHKPAGSPKQRFPGVEPTGPLPASIDFPLYPAREPSKFEALFFGDTQPRDVREVDYIRHDIVEPLIGKHEAAFGVTLGDVVFDDLAVLDPMIRTIALLDIPWYNVLGNHDINYDGETDEHSDETWERYFGPNYYSFDHGPVHFVVLDNVEWIKPENANGRYRGGIGVKQLAWLAKDLSMISSNQLVVFLMHIPIVETVDREAFFQLIENRPYALSVSAHTHYQEHILLKAEHGWKGKHSHHHVVNVTTCGSWWQGAPDERGIPHTTMRDGAPNGYSIFKFDGNQYKIVFRAARRPESYQMDIIAPDVVDVAKVQDTEVLVNVFGGSEKSKVEMRVGESGDWVEIAKVLRKDPVYEAAFEKDRTLQRPYRPLPGAIESPHMWAGRLPAGIGRGMHPIHVRTVDMFGQTYYATKGVFIR
jgi:hypothetical protein